MKENKLENLNVENEKLLITPKQLKTQFQLNKKQKIHIANSRRIISDIVARRDRRLLVVCGPCSIHEFKSAIDYAKLLKTVIKEIDNNIYLVMRVYLEKPRTKTGWKGLINDPYINNSFEIESGLKIARSLLIKLIDMQIPLATEILNPNSLQYFNDLFSWSAIGARTVESQIHREIASGVSMPVGFKNSTNNNLINAINAIHVASMPQTFISTNQLGQVCILQTKGNPYGHLILRGGIKPNYSLSNIKLCEKEMKQANLNPSIIIDCSHGNSNKDHNQQYKVAKYVLEQINKGNNSIIGLMIESNINEGKQSPYQSLNSMSYGVSITDACISWKATNMLLHDINDNLIKSIKN